METSPEYKSERVQLLSLWSMILIVLLNVVVSLSTVCIYDRYYAQKIKAFDIRGFMADQKKQFYGGKITEDELLKSLDMLDDILKKERKNTIILNNDAVIKNGEFIKP